jgi:hypothetical protein
MVFHHGWPERMMELGTAIAEQIVMAMAYQNFLPV